MLTDEFNFELDENKIAQFPADPRDSAKLLAYSRNTGEVVHTQFKNIADYLNESDVLVINETKVIPARIYGKKRNSKTMFEFLLLKRVERDVWEVIMKPGRKLKIGQYVDFAPDFCARLEQKKKDGVCLVKFFYDGVFEEKLDEYGVTPLPPYITKKLEDKDLYQTVYANVEGSAAAPTAGLHFTDELLEKIRAKGVKIAKITLHVGLGTFRPMKEERVEDHIMHSEYYQIDETAADLINRAKRGGKRVVAVGTTSVRALESAANEKGEILPKAEETDIFIYPGYRFKVVDALITNFHLPKSTLLMLVCAFGGKKQILDLYKTAAHSDYRFFSFGDAMFVY